MSYEFLFQNVILVGFGWAIVTLFNDIRSEIQTLNAKVEVLSLKNVKLEGELEHLKELQKLET